MESMQNIQDRLNEHNQGYIVEYTKPDGSKGVLNKLDLEAAKRYKAAKLAESEFRLKDHAITITVLVLIIVLIMVAMYIIYVNTVVDITGIYYDTNGSKIEVHHNKSIGNIEINGSHMNRTGHVKKINANTYGIYLDEDMMLKDLEFMSSPIAAYANIKTGDIQWKNDVWKLDRRSYAH